MCYKQYCDVVMSPSPGPGPGHTAGDGLLVKLNQILRLRQRVRWGTQTNIGHDGIFGNLGELSPVMGCGDVDNM